MIWSDFPSCSQTVRPIGFMMVYRNDLKISEFGNGIDFEGKNPPVDWIKSVANTWTSRWLISANEIKIAFLHTQQVLASMAIKLGFNFNFSLFYVCFEQEWKNEQKWIFYKRIFLSNEIGKQSEFRKNCNLKINCFFYAKYKREKKIHWKVVMHCIANGLHLDFLTLK